MERGRASLWREKFAWKAACTGLCAISGAVSCASTPRTPPTPPTVEQLAEKWPALEKPPTTWDHSVRGAVAMAARAAVEASREGQAPPVRKFTMPPGATWGFPDTEPSQGWPWVGRVRVTRMKWMHGCTGFNDSKLVAIELPSEGGVRYPLTLITTAPDEDRPRELPRMLHAADIATLARVEPAGSMPVSDGACVSLEGFPYVVANEGIMGYAVYSLAVTAVTPVPDAQCGAAR